MSNEQAHDMSEVIGFFQRLPLPEMQSAESQDSALRPVADLIRDWRRMESRDLPVATCTGLARCDDNTLFNVVGHCFDILLKRIVPRNNLRRHRRNEKRQRHRLKREVASALALVTAFGGGGPAPTGQAPVPHSKP